MAPLLSEVDHKLVSELFSLSKKNKKLVNSTSYQAPDAPEMTIRSWKMNEYKYYDVPSPFPTLARGLFTTWVPDEPTSAEGDEKGKYRIVARGYDKFFNIGEVPWTTVSFLHSVTYLFCIRCIVFQTSNIFAFYSLRNASSSSQIYEIYAVCIHR